MQTITFEPLRWQDAPSRVTITSQNGHPEAFFQFTAPTGIGAMTIGRPVEELPRILAILGPAHHLAGAMALDALFDVEAPEPAENMRRAMLHTYYFSEHLRKISFLLLSQTNPFTDLRVAGKSERIPHGLLDDVMHTIALAQEAAKILGGRSDHPITAVAGGISRYLKKEAYERLPEIAEKCLLSATRISGALNDTVLGTQGPLSSLSGVGMASMSCLTTASAKKENSHGTVYLMDDTGSPAAQFMGEDLPAKIGFRTESWSHIPFAFIQDQGWPGLQADTTKGLYFVGPLARLNNGQELNSPLAEEERLRMVSALGPPPYCDVIAAYWALLVELLQAAEGMSEMFAQKKFVGPSIRTVPAEFGTEGVAALEAPRGLIFHRYRVDPMGIVEDIDVLDTTGQNHTLFWLLTQKAVEVSQEQNKSWKDSRAAVELSLLPF